jgi:hypothetical protein
MSTLSEVLTLAGSQFKVYDLSRCITPIDIADFYQLETGQLCYPAPINGHARFALCFWAIQTPDTPYIWFIQFPVDELGYLKLSCRDQFLDLVIQGLGKDLQGTPDQSQAEALATNPYVFQPIDEKKAYFNARLKLDLDLPASEYYEHAQFYLKGQAGWDKWQTLALQGLADIIARLDQEDNSAMLRQALPHLPEAVLVAIAQLLEHQSLDAPLTQALLELHRQYRTRHEVLSTLLLRATASSAHHALRRQVLSDYFASHDCSEQGFVAIAGRLWQDLLDETIRYPFFDALARQQDPQLFNQLYADLSTIPALRKPLHAMLNIPVNSPLLAQALDNLKTEIKA